MQFPLARLAELPATVTGSVVEKQFKRREGMALPPERPKVDQVVDTDAAGLGTAPFWRAPFPSVQDWRGDQFEWQGSKGNDAGLMVSSGEKGRRFQTNRGNCLFVHGSALIRLILAGDKDASI